MSIVKKIIDSDFSSDSNYGNIIRDNTVRNSFLAIDFETANSSRYSACSIGLVKVINNEIVFCGEYLIKPPLQTFTFTHLHGITWEDVEYAPNFIQVWAQIRHLFNGIDFIVAHNASFDKSVLHACCQYYNLTPPNVEFKCTVQISRKKWNIRPTKLNNVCEYLGIPLNHHDAISDTIACAKIMLLALDNGVTYGMINNISLPKLVSNREQVFARAQKLKGRKSERKIYSEQSSQRYFQDNASSQTITSQKESTFKIIIQLIGLLILMYFLGKACGPVKPPWTPKYNNPKSEFMREMNNTKFTEISVSVELNYHSR